MAIEKYLMSRGTEAAKRSGNYSPEILKVLEYKQDVLERFNKIYFTEEWIESLHGGIEQLLSGERTVTTLNDANDFYSSVSIGYSIVMEQVQQLEKSLQYIWNLFEKFEHDTREEAYNE